MKITCKFIEHDDFLYKYKQIKCLADRKRLKMNRAFHLDIEMELAVSTTIHHNVSLHKWNFIRIECFSWFDNAWKSLCVSESIPLEMEEQV